MLCYKFKLKFIPKKLNSAEISSIWNLIINASDVQGQEKGKWCLHYVSLLWTSGYNFYSVAWITKTVRDNINRNLFDFWATEPEFFAYFPMRACSELIILIGNQSLIIFLEDIFIPLEISITTVHFVNNFFWLNDFSSFNSRVRKTKLSNRQHFLSVCWHNDPHRMLGEHAKS